MTSNDNLRKNFLESDIYIVVARQNGDLRQAHSEMSTQNGSSKPMLINYTIRWRFHFTVLKYFQMIYIVVARQNDDLRQAYSEIST